MSEKRRDGGGGCGGWTMTASLSLGITSCYTSDLFACSMSVALKASWEGKKGVAVRGRLNAAGDKGVWGRGSK